MKVFGKIILGTTLLMLLAACGKDNKSGQSNNFGWNGCNGINCNGLMYPGSQIPAINNQSYPILGVISSQNPCQGYAFANQRIPIQTQINLNTVVTPGDFYVGVTSFGDVAAIVGNGTRTATLLAYICPRSPMSGQGQVTMPSLGAYTRCQAKPIVAMNMHFPDGTVAKFRDYCLGF